MYVELTQLLREAAADDSIQSVILTAHGKYFTSGADLKEAQTKFLGGLSESHSSWAAPVGVFMKALLTFPKVLLPPFPHSTDHHRSH
jgi:enoyl-CoA hydratase/carnithine racemase